jgi:predicted RNA-binding Zn ribbon-like protein
LSGYILQVSAVPKAGSLLVADHPALEFLNSTYAPEGNVHELIGDGRALGAWLVEARLIDEKAAARWRRRFGADALDEIAREARALRTWAAEWIDRWARRPHESYETELRKLAELLERADDYPMLERVEGRFRVVPRRHERSPDEILAMLAGFIASLIAEEDPALVKHCEGSGCTLRFLDRTRAHRRRFCSVATCGNREKVAAFRARQRERG